MAEEPDQLYSDGPMPVVPSFAVASSEMFRTLKDLRSAWPTRGWSWDGRLSCVTSSFNVEVEVKARSAASIALVNEWTASTIRNAAPALREIVERAGGLRSGQLVLAGSTTAGPFAYGLWWPWGDGMTTSLRIGLGGPGATQDTLQRLRDAFGVEA